MTDLYALLQLADSGFPSGAFGHSFGLETAIAGGRVVDGASLEAWISSYVIDGCATLDGGALALALRGSGLRAIDARVTASQPNEEIRRANRHLARATLDVFAAIGIAGGSIDDYARDVANETSSGIHAIAAGLGYRAIGAALPETLEAYGATLVGGLVSAAARALPLGQRVAARARWRLRSAVETFVARALAVRDLDDLRSSAVACEIDGLRHRALPARLFAS